MSTKHSAGWLERFGSAKTLHEIVSLSCRGQSGSSSAPDETSAAYYKKTITNLTTRNTKLYRETKRLRALLDQHGVPHG